MIEAEDIELWSVGSKTEKDGFGVCRGWLNNQETVIVVGTGGQGQRWM